MVGAQKRRAMQQRQLLGHMSFIFEAAQPSREHLHCVLADKGEEREKDVSALAHFVDIPAVVLSK